MTSAKASFRSGVFRNPSEISIAPAALALAKAFYDRACADRGPTEVVAFFWFDDRRTRKKGTNDWTVHGPGLDLASWDEREFPAGAIWRLEGLSLAVGVPLDVLRHSDLKRIDVTATGALTLI